MQGCKKCCHPSHAQSATVLHSQGVTICTVSTRICKGSGMSLPANCWRHRTCLQAMDAGMTFRGAACKLLSKVLVKAIASGCAQLRVAVLLPGGCWSGSTCSVGKVRPHAPVCGPQWADQPQASPMTSLPNSLITLSKSVYSGSPTDTHLSSFHEPFPHS